MVIAQPSTQEHEQSQRRLKTLLLQKMIAVQEIDGALEVNKDTRNSLFSVSGVRGQYPQVFIREENGSFRFVGMWPAIEAMNESDDMPADILAANRDIKTFGATFAGCMRI